MGQNSLLVRFATCGTENWSGAVQAFARALEEASVDTRSDRLFAGVVEVALAMASLRVIFDPMRTDIDLLTQQLRDLGRSRDWRQDSPAPRRRWHVPVGFGPTYAPQLAEVATLSGQTEAAAIKTLTETELRVLAIGFAPGQPYIGLLPPNWDFPRQSALTPQVPAGALTVALRQLVLFANASPTGWRQVGLTAFRPFLAHRSTPFLLQAGDGICFHAVSDIDMQAIEANNEDGRGGARCEVLS